MLRSQAVRMRRRSSRERERGVEANSPGRSHDVDRRFAGAKQCVHRLALKARITDATQGGSQLEAPKPRKPVPHESSHRWHRLSTPWSRNVRGASVALSSSAALGHGRLRQKPASEHARAQSRGVPMFDASAHSKGKASSTPTSAQDVAAPTKPHQLRLSLDRKGESECDRRVRRRRGWGRPGSRAVFSSSGPPLSGGQRTAVAHAAACAIAAR